MPERIDGQPRRSLWGKSIEDHARLMRGESSHPEECRCNACALRRSHAKRVMRERLGIEMDSPGEDQHFAQRAAERFGI